MKMKEKITEIIHKVLFFGREVSDEWIANQKSNGMPFDKERADEILTLLKEEIKKSLLGDNEIYALEWESATLDMSFVDDYREEVKTLLQAQLDKVLKDL